MARIRTIKPEFWQNETLAGLPEHARLLAIALLNHADDSGFFLANPHLVRAACFPFEEHSKNVLGSLQELSRIGYVEVRECAGKPVGRICKFLDHQRIDKPQKSKLEPIFNENPKENDNSKNVPGTFQEPSKNVPRLEREQGTGNREEEREQGTGEEGDYVGSKQPTPSPAEIIEFWNLRRCQSCILTAKRKSAIQARSRDAIWQQSWKDAIEKITDSRFCNGQNDRGWVADLDWFLRPDTVVRLMEGKYDDKMANLSKPKTIPAEGAIF
jgi:hypothetical protein